VVDDIAKERASQVAAKEPLPTLTEEQRAQREAENGFRQFDRMIELIDEGIRPSRYRFRVSALMELNRLAIAGLQADDGAFRREPIVIHGSSHQPPPPDDVPRLVDEMCEYVEDNWSARSPVHLSSYVMWRLNWIHPWADGNGRTSRVVSYLVLCVRLGFRLPGAISIPERIAKDKFPYYDALDAADAAWRNGELDVSKMEALLDGHLAEQLLSVHTAATSP
jgi:Fic family protein